MQAEYRCRGCAAILTQTFVDLGAAPLSNAYLRQDDLDAAELTYPLHPRVCSNCFLVQLPQFNSPDTIFGPDYAYFSSYSESWLSHARAYVTEACDRLTLTSDSFVVEIASNDGYLLQYFLDRAVPVCGIEPAARAAEAAREKGVTTETFFFGKTSAGEFISRHRQADLVVANNVLAHVPELHDFVEGLSVLLAPQGVATVEVPHLLSLLVDVQFDTIYHEHFSYFSLLALEPVLASHGLRMFDVQRLSTHGGSLRLWICHAEALFENADAVQSVREEEIAFGLRDISTYAAFAPRVAAVKRSLLSFLIDAANAGKDVVGYGAAAKGNTLLNYCGIRSDMLPFVVDRNPHKVGRWLPGSRIPILAADRAIEAKPHYLLILPWNIRDEVVTQMKEIETSGGRFVVAIPELTILTPSA